ncbi:hypothetical protein HYH03_010606 [Edaphochlamys debaryana]|uniref:Uncharacterized protein n=1 Tax=Edaphochlamys debaryana TaxID=47281 RepID=A0A836BX90_9CHLO|nr:hypothetical protein HYH03_010606 [Edaphochlamys debaryana]|eukprot:KAG2490929.1 hypothetical protein HYH03_010606 [Edaphochlamys debaryana]
MVYDYDATSKKLYLAHIQPTADMSGTNGGMQGVLTEQGSITFEAFSTSNARMFGQAPLAQGGYGQNTEVDSRTSVDGRGFFMIVKTRDGSVTAIRQAYEATTVSTTTTSGTVITVSTPTSKISRQLLSRGRMV